MNNAAINRELETNLKVIDLNKGNIYLDRYRKVAINKKLSNLLHVWQDLMG